MRTRRTENLECLQIHDLLLPDTSKKERRRVKIERLLSDELAPLPPSFVYVTECEEVKQEIGDEVREPVRQKDKELNEPEEPKDKEEEPIVPPPPVNGNDLLLEIQKNIIEHQQQLIKHFVEKEQRMTADSLLDIGGQKVEKNEKQVFLVLDTESFKIPTSLGSETVIPLQVAWAVFEWDKENKMLVNVAKFIGYVSDVYCTSQFRDAIRKTSERCFLKHEEKNRVSKFPMLNVLALLEQLKGDIEKYNVKTLSAYNISWDFEALGNLIRLFFPGKNVGCPVLSAFDGRSDNPFNPMKLQHLDLMHEVVKKYGLRLIQAGIKDGTVHYNDAGKLMLRKNERYSKSIFSAEYALSHLFNVVQQHLADEDVDHEAQLLEGLLIEFGEEALEYGILYPQHSTYERMIKIATHEMNENSTDRTRRSDRSDECLFETD